MTIERYIKTPNQEKIYTLVFIAFAQTFIYFFSSLLKQIAVSIPDKPKRRFISLAQASGVFLFF